MTPEHRQRWGVMSASGDVSALEGELRVGTNTSVRVGYELTGSQGVGAFPAERSRTNIGVGYRFGEYASLFASYSMLRFDDSEGLAFDSLGEAKLVVRF